jgi:bacterial/archaeal transporter family protein
VNDKEWTRSPAPVVAGSELPRAAWLWYSMMAIIFWGAWAVLSKLGSRLIPAETTQFLFTVGAVPVAFVLLAAKRFKIGSNGKGVAYSLGNGIASGLGMLALYAAFRSGGNTSVIMVTTALYPMITVLLAFLILRERLTKLQLVGLLLAGAAMVIFSL